jgi:predicted nucleic acid-binding protein
MDFVIDASVTMAWCFEDEATTAADEALDRLRESHAVVPTIWNLEVANVLLIAQRRSRVSEAQVARFVRLLGSLPITTDPAPIDIAALLNLGRRHSLSSYDASYLELAERLGAPLATLDVKLAAAAHTAGVHVLGQ